MCHSERNPEYSSLPLLMLVVLLPSPLGKSKLSHLNHFYMSIAVFKGLSKSGNSAKVFLKRNKFEIGGTFGYLSATPFKECKEDDEVSVPDGWSIEHRSDNDGEMMTFDDGTPINFFTWAKAE